LLGGECEIRFRTCGFQGIYEATWNLGLQPSPKIDRVETRSPPVEVRLEWYPIYWEPAVAGAGDHGVLGSL
jgi:hypothetical protein